MNFSSRPGRRAIGWTINTSIGFERFGQYLKQYYLVDNALRETARPSVHTCQRVIEGRKFFKVRLSDPIQLRGAADVTGTQIGYIVTKSVSVYCAGRH